MASPTLCGLHDGLLQPRLLSTLSANANTFAYRPFVARSASRLSTPSIRPVPMPYHPRRAAFSQKDRAGKALPRLKRGLVQHATVPALLHPSAFIPRSDPCFSLCPCQRLFYPCQSFVPCSA